MSLLAKADIVIISTIVHDDNRDVLLSIPTPY